MVRGRSSAARGSRPPTCPRSPTPRRSSPTRSSNARASRPAESRPRASGPFSRARAKTGTIFQAKPADLPARRIGAFGQAARRFMATKPPSENKMIGRRASRAPAPSRTARPRRPASSGRAPRRRRRVRSTGGAASERGKAISRRRQFEGCDDSRFRCRRRRGDPGPGSGIRPGRAGLPPTFGEQFINQGDVGRNVRADDGLSAADSLAGRDDLHRAFMQLDEDGIARVPAKSAPHRHGNADTAGAIQGDASR